MYDEKTKIIRSSIVDEEVVGSFEAEKYPNCQLSDTNCKIEIKDFAISWKDASKLVEELSSVIQKYKI